MGYLHCCGGLHKTRSFVLVPEANYSVCEVDVLQKCPVCGHFVVQLTRADKGNNISSIRLTNAKARKFFQKLKSKILGIAKSNGEAVHICTFLGQEEE